MKFFKPEDFENYIKALGLHNPVSAKIVADIAESKLKREGVVVNGFYDGKKYEAFGCRMEKHEATHTGLLINVEEIDRKPCVHVGSLARNTGNYYFECTKCGEKIKPTAWEVVK